MGLPQLRPPPLHRCAYHHLRLPRLVLQPKRVPQVRHGVERVRMLLSQLHPQPGECLPVHPLRLRNLAKILWRVRARACQIDARGAWTLAGAPSAA
eukprot:1194958-Prorocentrum_minimum.AAC.6